MLCRAPPLVRKTRAQLKQEADEEAAARRQAGPPKQERQPAPAELKKQEHEAGQDGEEEDVNIMDALDAFSALAGPQKSLSPVRMVPFAL